MRIKIISCCALALLLQFRGSAQNTIENIIAQTIAFLLGKTFTAAHPVAPAIEQIKEK
ncbi:hypothetical protein [Agriterribacter sp.]|uniref:hypothetical protein n=1 Tax=Agriterribacter sp. TaxID=2821509 RepID=UPI002C8036C7|nr:hypothetical protein [Agriterribacter sp.]HRO45177.1 hypothetical protein [Agriterribacter sp.]HRQ17782.1 hypothetical protein [Agriterribacter sp.]